MIKLYSSYPTAGNNAPPEVKEAIARYFRLPKEERDRLPLLHWLLGSATPPYKMSARDSCYQEPSPIVEQNCMNCRFSYRGIIPREQGKTYICSMIRPYIQPDGWCRLWKEGK